MLAEGRVNPKRQLPETALAEGVTGWPRDPSPGLRLRIPSSWRSSVDRNPHAAQAAKEVSTWFGRLGCSERELDRAGQFDIAGYMGIAFPLAPAKQAVLIAKFISLWLLWDDVHVESRKFRWRLDENSLGAQSPPTSFSRFDRGWWALFRELSQRRSGPWLLGLCTAMKFWDDAAAAEADIFAGYATLGKLPEFTAQLELRAITIGMGPTIILLEDVHDQELPESFHDAPVVKRLKWLSGLLVGLGNEIFSLGKDLAERHPNLVSNLILSHDLSATEAIARLVTMHDQGVVEFDRVAAPWRTSNREAPGGFAIFVLRHWASPFGSRWPHATPPTKCSKGTV
jgi:hypothetical protein